MDREYYPSEKKPAVATGMTLVAAMAVRIAASAVWREADSRSLDIPYQWIGATRAEKIATLGQEIQRLNALNVRMVQTEDK